MRALGDAPRYTSTPLREMLVLCALVAACSCGDSRTALAVTPARVVPGGGVAGPALRGVLHLHVVDSASGAALVGATLRIGVPPNVTGTTGDGGLFTSDEGLVGPQVVTASAAGHVTVTWIGVDAANATIPLDASSPAEPASAHVTGSVEGLASLPPVAEGHYRFAAVDYTRPKDLASLENLVRQAVSGGRPANACVVGPQAACQFSLATRTGAQAHFATVLDGDMHGTPADPTDDTLEVVGFAHRAGLSLAAGEQRTSETLAVVGREHLSALDVRFQPPPDGTTRVVGVPGVSLGGEQGVMLVPSPLVPGHARAWLPVLADDLAAGNYWIIATAFGTDPLGPTSTVIARRLTDPAAGADLPAWPSPPSALTAVGRTFSFAPVQGATLNGVDFRDPRGALVWRVLLLDGGATFMLPDMDPDPLAARPLDAVVTAVDVPFDARDFVARTLRETLVRASASHTRLP